MLDFWILECCIVDFGIWGFCILDFCIFDFCILGCWILEFCIWNFGWPEVPPIADVVVAVALSILAYQYKNYKK